MSVELFAEKDTRQALPKRVPEEAGNLEQFRFDIADISAAPAALASARTRQGSLLRMAFVTCPSPRNAGKITPYIAL